ncbi:MAG: single-stranded DNA-binding protein [Gammaproteobacteria bacterium]|nr:single-stranded DNA-binding protein [Gammaproteobacteria bacterium]
MAFGLNRVELIGRIGQDVTVNHLASGGRVANLSVATDESYLNRQSGAKVDKVEWHRLVTFQDGLITMLEKHAKKGRLIYVEGKLQTRRWKKDGEDSDRFSTEILLVPGGKVQFLDRPSGPNGNGASPAKAEAAPAESANPQGGAPESMNDFDDDIPF